MGDKIYYSHDFGARISVGAKVRVIDDGYMIPVGEGLLGRVTDALDLHDEKPIPTLNDKWPLLGKELNPLAKILWIPLWMLEFAQLIVFLL